MLNRLNKIIKIKGTKMDTEALGQTKIGRGFMKIMASIMESSLRYKFFGSEKILEGSGIKEGMKVLEVGCGTGFFTINASKIIGNSGLLISIDMSSLSVEMVTKKVEKANLRNVKVIKGNALDTKLEESSIDEILIFGVIPAPMLPMNQLLLEMHRILKPNGIMSVWPPSWVNHSIIKSKFFKLVEKRNGVRNFQRLEKN
jgi:ubiquinone/menaquinone biosynthesis C-methylase UbiE